MSDFRKQWLPRPGAYGLKRAVAGRFIALVNWILMKFNTSRRARTDRRRSLRAWSVCF